MTAQAENVSDSKGRHIPVISTTPVESLKLCSGRPGRKPRDAAWSVQRTARTFERWICERAADWSPELNALARNLLRSLEALDQPDVSDVFVRECARDLQAFENARSA